MAMKMGFLNNAKEPSEMDLVIGNIAQVEQELREKIFQLGQTYYEEHVDDTEDKYYPIIDAITKLNLNRRGFYKNKLRLQGKMMCENCGAELPYGSIFCNSCGKKADEKQENGEMVAAGSKKCAVCGAILSTESLFCTSCGSKVEQ